jgi:hypothetical protein
MDIDNIYYKKYLKYKLKYLEFKQSGGNNIYLLKLKQYKTPCIYYHDFLILLLDSFINKFEKLDVIKTKLNNIKGAIERSLLYFDVLEKRINSIIDQKLKFDEGLHIKFYDLLNNQWIKEKNIINNNIISSNDLHSNVEFNQILKTILDSNYINDILISFDNKIFKYLTVKMKGQLEEKRFQGIYYTITEPKKLPVMEKILLTHNENWRSDCFQILSKIIDLYFNHIDVSIYEIFPYEIKAKIDKNKEIIKMIKIEEERKQNEIKRIEELKQINKMVKRERKEERELNRDVKQIIRSPIKY